MTTTTNKSAIKSPVKPVGRLDASMLLARKGEAQPAVAATTQNNPSLAWGVYTPPVDAHHPATATAAASKASEPQARPPQAAQFGHGHKPTASAARLRPDSFVPPRSSNGVKVSAQSRSLDRMAANEDRDPVALTMRVEDNTYLRLTYLAQTSGKTVQQVLNAALEGHLIENGLPVTRKLVVRPK